MDALQLGSNSLASTLSAVATTVESWAIPVNSAGNIPRYIYIASSGNISFLMGRDVGGTSTSISGLDTTDTSAVIIAAGCRLGSGQPLVVTTAGFDSIITVSADATASYVFVITPLEN
jgi:hypothetical protein